MVKQNFRYIVTPPLWFIKWRKSEYVVIMNAMNGVQRRFQPLGHSCIGDSTIWPDGLISTFKGRKRVKNAIKNCQTFQNLLHLHMEHENLNAGSVWGKYKIYERCFPFWPPSPLKWALVFLLPKVCESHVPSLEIKCRLLIR